MKSFFHDVYISSEEHETPPSVEDGYSGEEEILERMYGCELITDAGHLLKLPQIVMMTAQVLFHRFYYTRSFYDYEVRDISMACLLLACKIEENIRQIDDILNVFYRIKQVRGKLKREPLGYSPWYYDKKKLIIEYEQKILQVLGFNIYMEHPHRLLLNYLYILEASENQPFIQKSWDLLCDSYRLDLCVRFKPEIVACACIFLAAKYLDIGLPESPPWWEIFDCTQDEIDEVSYYIYNMYKLPKPQRKSF